MPAHRRNRLRHGRAGARAQPRLGRIAAARRRGGGRTGRPRFVAGALGPTSRTASLSPKVNDPGFRNTSFDELAASYAEATRGLIEGGVDVLLVETIFDTLNAKAALFAVRQVLDELALGLPILVSGTITDASGRTLSGQTVEAFWNSIRHARPLVVGLNCALGARQLRPYVEELARIADAYVCAYPNAGLPNAFGEYDEAACETAELLRDFAASGFVNIVGGCCGTTPDHVAHIREAVDQLPPRRPPVVEVRTRLAGLEPLNIGPDSLFVNVGERTNVTGSAKFRRLIEADDYAGALEVARQQVASGAQMTTSTWTRGCSIRGRDGPVPKPACRRADVACVPVMIDSSKWVGDRSGTEVPAGQGCRQFDQPKEGEATSSRRRGASGLRRRGGSDGFDEAGQADTVARKISICDAAIASWWSGRGPAGRHHLRSDIFAVATVSSSTTIRARLHRGHGEDPGRLSAVR